MKGDKKGRNTGLRTVIAPGTRAWDMIKDQNIICTGVQETGTKGIFFAGKKGHNKDTMVIPNVDGSSGSIRPRANDLPQSTNTVPGEGVKLKKKLSEDDRYVQNVLWDMQMLNRSTPTDQTLEYAVKKDGD